MTTWQESPVTIKKKKTLPSLIKVNALLFVQYEQTNFSYVLQPDITLYARKSFIVHIKVFFV
jgi:hypothetical protein